MDKYFLIEWNYDDSTISEFETETEVVEEIEKRLDDDPGVESNLELFKGKRISIHTKWIKDSKYSVELKEDETGSLH